MNILGIIASSTLAAAGDFESIATVSVGGGGAASVTFSSIPATYTHLQLRGIACGPPRFGMEFNSDTASNYNHHFVYGDGASVGAGGSANTTPASGTSIGIASTGSTYFTPFVVDILDYANTNKYKTFRGLGGADQNGSGSIFFTSGLWQNTNAITTIRLFPSSGNLAEYTQYALYGIKGA